MNRLLTTAVVSVILLSFSCRGDDYYNLAIMYGKRGDFETAIKYFNKAIEKNPRDVDAWHNRGNSKFSLKDYRGAISDYTKALELKPDDFHSYTNRGVTKMNIGLPYDAIADFTKAIEINPEFELAYYQRARAHYAFKDYVDACNDFYKARSLGFHDADEQLDGICK